MAIYDDEITGRGLQRTVYGPPDVSEMPFVRPPQRAKAAATTSLPSAGSSSGALNLINLAAGAGGLGALAQVGFGIYQGINAKRLQQKFDAQEKATFAQSLGPLNENRSMFQRQMQQGLSPQARALATQTAAGQQASQFRQINDISGGQMGSALGRLGALNTNQLGLNLALQDQQARERAMQGIASVNREVSQVQRMDIQRKQRMEDMAMQQIAGLRQDALQNISGAVGSIPTGLSNLAYIQALTSKTS